MNPRCLLMLLLTAAPGLAFAGGPVEVGSRPTGALDGKIVYVHGGHGYTADNLGSGAWTTQRPLLLGMVEDLGNKDQMDLFVEHAFRAGATIAPMRPVGHQPHEVVLDNADPAVAFAGAWRTGKGSVSFGRGSSDWYRIATTAPRETATAVYRPDLPAAGLYPVYAWTPSGKNRPPDQLYRIHHTGGATEVTVDHRRVGNGLVYLGSYRFNAGRGGAVEISNRSREPGRDVAADMIRFGNGRGDLDRGGGVSGLKREDEAGLYWITWHAVRSRGVPKRAYRVADADRSATVSASPRYSAFMNREQSGGLSDRVLVSFHSNSSTGASRGVLGLLNGNNYHGSRTPNQELLAGTIAREINTDLVALAGRFEHDWADRGDNLVLDRTDIEFGELNNRYLNDEFDATIVETGFHDNRSDAEMLRDPRVRDALARATCEGLVKYFRRVEGGNDAAVAAPVGVGRVVVRSHAAGSVTLRWAPGNDPVPGADSATGYVVYTSIDSRGFDSGRPVDGGATHVYTVAGLDPRKTYFFRIAARNTGGVSGPSETLACQAKPTEQRVLIVDGFDRLDRRLNPTEPYRDGGRVERVRPRWSNPRNLAASFAEIATLVAPGVAFDSASNDSVLHGDVDLSGYDAVCWMLGQESSADRTLDEAEQAAVRAYLDGGGRLLVCGAELAWDLDQLNHGRDFCRSVLRTRFVADQSGSQRATGAPDSIFEGLALALSHQADSADAVAPSAGATAALTFDRGNRAAAVQFADGEARLVVMTIPLEAFANRSDRQEVVRRVLAFFGMTTTPGSK